MLRSRYSKFDRFVLVKFTYCVLTTNFDTVHPTVFLMVLMATAVRVSHGKGDLLIVIERN